MTGPGAAALESCCGQEAAGRDSCELPSVGFGRAPRHKAMCPGCEEVGKPVSIRTVKSMLAISLRSLRGRDYFFCRTPTCSVVYFVAGGSEVYERKDLRQRVYQKEPGADDVPICYCFGHTAGQMRAASIQARQALAQDIRDGIQQGQCACDVRNPKGSCCLGDVIALERVLQAAASE